MIFANAVPAEALSCIVVTVLSTMNPHSLMEPVIAGPINVPQKH